MTPFLRLTVFCIAMLFCRAALQDAHAADEANLDVDATLNFGHSELSSIGISVRIRNIGSKPSLGWQQSCPLGLFEIKLRRVDKVPASEMYSSVIRPVAHPRDPEVALDPFSPKLRSELGPKRPGRDDVQPGEVVLAGAMFSIGQAGLRGLQKAGVVEPANDPNHIAENGVYEFSVTMLREKKNIARFRFEIEDAEGQPMVRVLK